MIEKGKISASQLALMIIPSVIATAGLTVAAITSKYAGRDMWISPIWGSVTGFFTLFIILQLHKLFPQETFIQYSERILGRMVGKIVGFLYVFIFLHISGIINLQYAFFINSSFLPNTPPVVLKVCVVLVCAFAVRGGVEVLGRVAQLFTPIFLFSPFFLILLFPELKLKEMFPIFEHGLLPSIMGSAVPQAWFSEIFIIAILLSSVTNQEKGAKWGIITVLVCTIFLVIDNLVCIMLFGNSVTSYSYPVFSLFRYIKVATFFEHLEALMIIIWFMGAFIKLSVFYYVFVLVTAQWLKLSDYRPLVLPLGFLIVIYSIIAFPNTSKTSAFQATIEPFSLPLLFTILPTLLLIIGIIQKKRKNEGAIITK